MKAIFSGSGVGRIVLVLLTVAAAARGTAMLVALFLPPSLPVSTCPQTDGNPVKLTLPSAWDGKKRVSQAPVAPTEEKMTGYRLLLTAVGDGGVAMVAKNGGKGRILKVGEEIDGFRLESVYTDRAVFVKNGKRYMLTLKCSDGDVSLKRVSKTAAKPSVESRYADQIQQEDGTFFVPKELLGEMHDLKKIFKRISIVPVRKGKKLEGFLVTRVARGSVFEKIGLRPRDMIVAVDGKPLKKESDAMAYFGKLSDLSALELTVVRNHKKKVIRYEVY